MTDRHSDDRTSGGESVSAFEQRLREGLHTSASSVQPAPDGWCRVQARLRRRRTLQVGGFAVAGAAAVLIGVLVLGNVPETAITFDPGVGASTAPVTPTTEQVTADTDATVVDPTQGVAAGPPGEVAAVLYADVDGVHMITPDGTAIATDVVEVSGPVTDIAVRPGSTPDDVVLVVRTEDTDGCGQLWWTTFGVDPRWPTGTQQDGADLDGEVEVYGTENVVVDPDSTGCAGAPVFASDGSALVWLTDPAGSGDADTEVRAVSWSGSFPEGAVQRVATSFPGASPHPVEWTVVPGQPEEGILHVRMIGPDGDAAVEPVGVSLVGDTLSVDEVLVLTGQSARDIPRVLDTDDGWALGRPATPFQDGVEDDREVVWSLTTLSIDTVVSADSALSWAPGEPLYMDGLGATVVMGTGGPMVLSTRTGSGDATRSNLPVAISAALLGSGDPVDPQPTDPASAGEDPEPSGGSEPTEPTEPTEPNDPAGQAEPADQAVPPPAMGTASAIRDAALAGDWEALRALVPADGFTASFGGTDDPIAYYQQLQAEGTDVLGILAGLLDGPAAAVPDTDLWAWPREFVESDGYYDWRVGITADGTWRYFVAGD